MLNHWPSRVSAFSRGRLRVSVRALMVVTLLLSLGLASLVRKAHFQRRTVQSIRSAGGVVLYDWKWKDGRGIPEHEPSTLDIASRFLGVDYFHDVTWIQFTGIDACDDDLIQIAQLPRIELLVIPGSRLTDRGLAQIEGMRSLRFLDISSPHVTDRGIAYLARLRNLRVLNLSRTAVTDVGLDNLMGLTNLEWLGLKGTRVTYRGLERLNRALPHCKTHMAFH
jgi:hypothetical protein